MKIKRYTDKDRRTVMSRVREELGADAVVLSSRAHEDGFTMVVATEYDADQLNTHIDNLPANGNILAASVREPEPEPSIVAQPQALVAPRAAEIDESKLNNLQQELSNLRTYLEKELPRVSDQRVISSPSPKVSSTDILRDKMYRFGLSDTLTEGFIKQIGKVNDSSKGWRQAMTLLRNQIRIPALTPLEQEGVIALVGPSGSGKTTTLCKLAARYVMQGGRKNLAIISMDSKRFGAQEQIRRFAGCLRIPVQVVSDIEDLPGTLDKFSEKKLILIDATAQGAGNAPIGQLLESFRNCGRRIDSLLTLPATQSAAVLDDLAHSLEKYSVSGVVITKIDESLNLVPLLDVVVQNRWPVCYLTSGHKVPQDIEVADADQLMRSAVQLNKRSRSNRISKNADLVRQVAGHI